MLYRKPKGSAVGSGEGAASESTSEEEAPGETAFTVTKRRRVRRSQPLDQKKKKKNAKNIPDTGYCKWQSPWWNVLESSRDYSWREEV